MLAGRFAAQLLTGERSLLVTWLNRGTLHLICSEDYWWLHSLTALRSATASTRRLAQEAVPPRCGPTPPTCCASQPQPGTPNDQGDFAVR